MRWPDVGDKKPSHTHAEAHSDPSHHIGPCDRACRQGLRYHLHEDPRARTFGLAASRAEEQERAMREARGLKPAPADLPDAPPGWMTEDERERAWRRFQKAKYEGGTPLERV